MRAYILPAESEMGCAGNGLCDVLVANTFKSTFVHMWLHLASFEQTSAFHTTFSTDRIAVAYKVLQGLKNERKSKA